MRLTLSSRLKALRLDESGTAIVELALIAPFLAVLTVGIADLSRGMTRRLELSEAVHRTLEKAAARNFTFNASDTEPNYDWIKAETVAAAGGSAEGVTAADVVVTTWLECDGEEEDDYFDTCAANQTTARYLQIRLNSYFKPSFGAVVTSDADGKYPLFAEAAVRIQ